MCHMNNIRVKAQSERNTKPTQASQVGTCENSKHGSCFVQRDLLESRQLFKLSASNERWVKPLGITEST